MASAGAQPQPETPATNTSPMGGGMKIGLGVYIAALLLMLIYLLIRIWPVDIQAQVQSIEFLWGTYQFHLEIRYFLLAALAGALGSYIHLATSFADYAGNDQLSATWAWWYFLRPCIGASLAVIVYLSIRGGIVTGGGAGAVSPYGIGAICALSGLFSKQATDKLREVFENLFRTQNPVERSDPLKKA